MRRGGLVDVQAVGPEREVEPRQVRGEKRRAPGPAARGAATWTARAATCATAAAGRWGRTGYSVWPTRRKLVRFPTRKTASRSPTGSPSGRRNSSEAVAPPSVDSRWTWGSAGASERSERRPAVHHPGVAQHLEQVRHLLVAEEELPVVAGLVPAELLQRALVRRAEPRALAEQPLHLDGARRLGVAPAHVHQPGPRRRSGHGRASSGRRRRGPAATRGRASSPASPPPEGAPPPRWAPPWRGLGGPQRRRPDARDRPGGPAPPPPRACSAGRSGSTQRRCSWRRAGRAAVSRVAR